MEAAMNHLQSEVLDALRHAEMARTSGDPGMPEYRATLEVEQRLHELYWELVHAGPLTDAREEQARRTFEDILAQHPDLDLAAGVLTSRS
jgi:hypothetical protein